MQERWPKSAKHLFEWQRAQLSEIKCCKFQEKEWLKSFYFDVEKCIRQNESDGEFAEVCFSALQRIKRLHHEQDENDVSSSRWLPLGQQVVSLDTLFRKDKDVFGGSLICSESQEDIVSGKSTLQSFFHISITGKSHLHNSSDHAFSYFHFTIKQRPSVERGSDCIS